MEILSILFLSDQTQKTSNQEMYLEQVFQQHVCAMAQEINKGAIKIRIKEEKKLNFFDIHILIIAP